MGLWDRPFLVHEHPSIFTDKVFFFIVVGNMVT